MCGLAFDISQQTLAWPLAEKSAKILTHCDIDKSDFPI
jgi:hypothetical protein